MKKQDFVQIKGIEVKELHLKIKTLKQELEGLTLDKNRKILKDLKTLSKKRKDIAQILTVINQKQSLLKLEAARLPKGDK